jgi:hypothetical protein
MKKIACSLALSIGALLSAAVTANAALYDWNLQFHLELAPTAQLARL